MMSRLVGMIGLVLSLAGPAMAWDNICEIVAPLVNGTTAQLDELLDKRLLHRSFQGAGKVRDVKGGGISSKYTVVVDCGNDVLAEIPTSAPRASSNLKVGESVNFSGMLTGLYRRRYVNTHGYYLLTSFNDNSSVW